MRSVCLRPSPRRAGWQGLARAGAAAGVVLAAVALGAPHADAHVALSASSPEAESTASGLPHQVQLKFVVPAVADPRTDLSVVAPSGQNVAVGATTVTDLGVGQELSATDETGWYRVHYRVVLWGGHVDQGGFRFLVEPGGDNRLGRWAWLASALLLLPLVYVLHAVGGRRKSAGPLLTSTALPGRADEVDQSSSAILTST